MTYKRSTRAKQPDAGKTAASEVSSQSSERTESSLQKSIMMALASAEDRTRQGCVLKKVQITTTWLDKKTGKEVVDSFSLDESAGNAFLKRMASSSSSLSTSSAQTSTGYIGDASSGSKSSSGSSKRVSTLSSATLSTIEGRGARLSITSSVESVALPASERRRASVVSVQADSPGSDVEVMPTVPEFRSPDGRPPRPHGQPSAVSSLKDSQERRRQLDLLVRGLESPPAATSTQTERSPAAARRGRHVAFSGDVGSDEMPVAGTSSSSPEIPELPPPLPAESRPLTDQEEEELSGREQRELAVRQLQADIPCFAMWMDQSYYPGRLRAAGRDGRWHVQFEDGTKREVPASHVLPVATLWKGLSVFVRPGDDKEYYVSAIITGHRMRVGEDPVEYIVSLDSQSVTCAVPRGRILLTRDQAALVTERRGPALAQLAVSSPGRDAVSLDNLVSGRRRTAGSTGRRMPDFDTSSGQEAAGGGRPGGSGAAAGVRRRRGSRTKGPATPAKARGQSVPASADAPAAAVGAEEAAAPAGAGDPATPPRAAPRGAGTPSPSAGSRRSRRTPPTAAQTAVTPRGRKGSRAKSAGTPAKGAETASTVATPSGRRRKRVTASTPTKDPDQPAAEVATPRGRGRKQKAASMPAEPEPEATAATPSGRGRKRKVASVPAEESEPVATAATPSGRGRKRKAASMPAEEPEPEATAATPSGRGRKPRVASMPAEEPEPVATAATPSGRGRKRKATSLPAEEPEPAAAAATPSGKRKRTAEAAAREPEPAATVATPGGRGRGRPVAAVAGEAEAAEAQEPPMEVAASAATSRLQKSRKPSKLTRKLPADTSSELEQPLEDFPEEESSLFKGLTVILTCASVTSAARRKFRRKMTPPYDKEHVKRHVECRGGHVLAEPALGAEDVEGVRQLGDLLLISNGPLRTAKYITCVAMGVPCVQTLWLVDSIREGKRMPYEDYLLAAGVDPYTGQHCEQLLSRPARPPPLRALRALVADAADSEWGQTMTRILAAAGAEVKLDDQDPGEAALPFRPDVVVAQPDSPAAVLRWARQVRVPAVSGEWVIASIVTYERQPFDGRPEFNPRSRPAEAGPLSAGFDSDQGSGSSW